MRNTFLLAFVTVIPGGSGLIDSQFHHDVEFEAFSPNLGSDVFEVIPGLGEIELDKVLSRSSRTISYSLKSHPNLMIEYEVDCRYRAEDHLHPLYRNFVFQSLAAGLGIAPKVFFVSPPAEYWFDFKTEIPHPKMDFDLTNRQIDKCRVNKGQVRFTVMERVKFCLTTFHYWLHDAVDIGKNLISLVGKLHREGGMIHNAIEPKNVCFLDNEATTPVLVNYREAGSAEYESDRIIYKPNWFNNMKQSPWRIEGYAPGRRDDVYNAFFVVAQIMNVENAFVGFDIYRADQRHLELAQYKRSNKILQPERWADPFAIIPDRKVREEILGKFQSILSLIVSLDSVSSVIDYTAIHSKFVEAGELLAQSGNGHL